MNERDAPAWYRWGSALQSAVEHLAATFPSFNWVGIYVLRGDTLELGPYIGAPTEHTRIKVGVGVCGTAVARNADMNVPDVRALDNYLACSLETASELVALVRAPDGPDSWADRHRQPHASGLRSCRRSGRPPGRGRAWQAVGGLTSTSLVNSNSNRQRPNAIPSGDELGVGRFVGSWRLAVGS